MAIRPVVLVYQEFENPTTVPTTPDLECLIVGPAYQTLDYGEDKDDIVLDSEYGVLEGDIGEATPTGPAHITEAAPSRVPGALVDAATVAVYFDDVRVIVADGTKMTTSSASPGTVTTAETAPTTFKTVGAVDEVKAGDRLILSDGTNYVVRTILAVVSNTSLKLTADFPAAGWTFAGSQSWRIERKLDDQYIDEDSFSMDGNDVIIDGDITLRANDDDKVVSYAKVYVSYTALRQDLQEVDSVSSVLDIESKIGRLDARNPLAVGCFVALQNTTSKINFYGVKTNDLEGHTRCRDAISANRDIYAIVPLLTDTATMAMWKTNCEGLSLPDEDQGRPQKFRVVIGSGKLPLTQDMVEARAAGSGTGISAVDVGSTPTGAYRLTVPGGTFVTQGVIPGDKVTIALDSGGVPVNGVYTVAQVVEATILEIDGNFPSAKSLHVDATIGITNPGGTTTRRTVGTASAAMTTAVGSDLYLTLQDANGTFVSSGVTPGDLVQMSMTDPTSADFDDTNNLSSWVIDSVVSDNRLLLFNKGRNTSMFENELPHGVKRTGGALVPTTPTLNYRIARELSKDGQVTNLVTVAQSFNSRRVILVWPDTVDVAGIEGGDNQPGYYLACAVGGMTAGLPPHQGFTNLGIAGISRIYKSNTYFTDEQLTDLMQGGWYIFAQQTPDSLPYTIHQLTTDPATLETGEFSVVKNFDYVALFFVDILEDFLGTWNVTDETMGFIRSAVHTGLTTLRLRTYAKIGAPLRSGSVIQLGSSATSEDRIVVKISVGLPKPLNVIELRLVA